MDRRVLVDSSALVAFFHRRDQKHREACRGMEALRKSKTVPLLPDYVIGEVGTFFKRFSFEGCRVALAGIRSLLEAGAFELAMAEPVEIMDATAVILELQDPDFTFFDALSVVLARRRNIRHIFGFDRAFSALGFPPPWEK